MKENSTTIYYAHHRWKYSTQVEQYELDLIKRFFPHANIFNPGTDLSTANFTEKDIMAECIEVIRYSDIVIFSSMDGVIGAGVYEEITKAKELGKLVLYIYQDELVTGFKIRKNDRCFNDRLYGFVDVKGE